MARSIVVDPTDDPTSGQPPPGSANSNPAPDVDLPEKFRGKSAKEIVDMYTNLESETGRLRNELGDTRSEARTWRTLAEQLRTAEPQPEPRRRDPVQISSDDIITKPRESIASVVDELFEERIKPVVTETQKLRRQSEEAEFVRDFPNYVQTGNDPEFQEWVGKSRKRVTLAQKALSEQDIGAMRELMEDWEERTQLLASLKPITEEPDQGGNMNAGDSAPTGVEGARRVATERPGNGAPVLGGKVFYEQDVIKTLIQNPDKYYSAAYQTELMDAMKAGRYKK